MIIIYAIATKGWLIKF